MRGRKNSFEKLEYKFLPEIVYGGIDGAITTFAVVSGAIGASLGSAIVLILGFANLIGDGFSMSISNYLSTKSQKELHPKSHNQKPVKTATATFVAFILVGLVPLLPFLVAAILNSPHLITYQFLYSFILTGIALAIVGAIKGKVIGKHSLRSALETLIIGGIAAVLAFSVGYLVKTLLT